MREGRKYGRKGAVTRPAYEIEVWENVKIRLGVAAAACVNSGRLFQMENSQPACVPLNLSV